MTHENDVGYALQSSLLVSAETGAPLGVPAQNLVTAQGVWSSQEEAINPWVSSHLDELSERMTWLEQQALGAKRVHLVDREADSVAHLRWWAQNGQLWRVRVKGHSAQQWTASAPVVLMRAAKPKRVGADGQRIPPVAGEPLAARLVVSLLFDESGRLLAEWFLLTSVPETVDDARIALWYYFLW